MSSNPNSLSGIAFGLSVDAQPSDLAKWHAQKTAASSTPVHEEWLNVTLTTMQTRIMDFKVRNLQGEVEIVVLTITDGPAGLGNPPPTFQFDISLSPNSELNIRSTTAPIHLVVMTPVLAQLAPYFTKDKREGKKDDKKKGKEVTEGKDTSDEDTTDEDTSDEDMEDEGMKDQNTDNKDKGNDNHDEEDGDDERRRRRLRRDREMALRCHAHIADGKQCRLKRVDGQWCPFHRDQHEFLHQEPLKERKKWHEHVQNQAGYMGRELEDNIHSYNQIQESLALRTLVTKILYQGNEDASHWASVVTTRKNRGILAYHLKTVNNSDGSGRESVLSCIGHFLALMRQRETNPTSAYVRRTQVTVKLNDVRRIQAFAGPGHTPSIFDILAEPGPTFMLGRLYTRAHSVGNLPPLSNPRDDIPAQPVNNPQYWGWHVWNFGAEPDSPTTAAEKAEMNTLMDKGNSRTPQEEARYQALCQKHIPDGGEASQADDAQAGPSRRRFGTGIWDAWVKSRRRGGRRDGH